MPDEPNPPVVESLSPTSDLPGMDPKSLLEAEKAKQQLRELEVRQVADLIPVFRSMVEAELQKIQDLIHQLEKVLSQALEMHEMQMEDAQTQFQITKTMQSTIVMLEQVEDEGILQAAVNNPSKNQK